MTIGWGKSQFHVFSFSSLVDKFLAHIFSFPKFLGKHVIHLSGERFRELENLLKNDKNLLVVVNPNIFFDFLRFTLKDEVIFQRVISFTDERLFR